MKRSAKKKLRNEEYVRALRLDDPGKSQNDWAILSRIDIGTSPHYAQEVKGALPKRGVNRWIKIYA